LRDDQLDLDRGTNEDSIQPDADIGFDRRRRDVTVGARRRSAAIEGTPT
jgi:hypothetical protein